MSDGAEMVSRSGVVFGPKYRSDSSAAFSRVDRRGVGRGEATHAEARPQQATAVPNKTVALETNGENGWAANSDSI